MQKIDISVLKYSLLQEATKNIKNIKSKLAIIMNYQPLIYL